MIKKINKLKNCGIFRDFKWDNAIPEFDRYNLFYGLNGSGKSTLSQALSFFSSQASVKDLGGYEIEVTENVGAVAGNKTLKQTLSNPVYVFNKDFIQKNIEADGKLDEIIYLSEENIEAKTQVETLKKEIENLRIKKEAASSIYNTKKKIFDKLEPRIASRIKKNLIEIGGLAAKKYSNFDRRNVERYYSLNNAQLKTIIPNSDAEINKLKVSLKETTLPIVTEVYNKIEIEEYETAIRHAKLLLGKNVKNEVKSKYSSEIMDWIEQGLKLHVDETECSFCGGSISADRMNFLNQLFSKEYKLFIAEIEDTIKDLELFICPFFEMNYDLYSEHNNQAEKAIRSLNVLRKEYNSILESFISQLKEKKGDIEKLDFKDLVFDNLAIVSINNEIETIENCIANTNKRTENFEKKQSEELSKLVELLFNKFLIEEKYTAAYTELCKSAVIEKDLTVEIETLETKIFEIESKIRDVFIAAKEFNRLLHQFLGRQEISLEFDSTLKGYKLIRESKKAERLSDGEKTAIVFIYFLTKIRENGNLIENSIIILDDPISSLDSNNIFNAFAFIFALFESCHQLFVLTHNFTFFSLLKRKIGTELKKGNNMYLIENPYKQIGECNLREAKIVKLPQTLNTLNSDYAFSFKQIMDTIHANDTISNLDDCFLLSNSCRKILETFCSFKFINSKFSIETVKNLYKLNKVDKEGITTEEIAEAEKIYRFVNHYSHGGKFSIISEIDGIIGEALPIAQSIVRLIERADKTHHDQLMQAIKS